MATAPNPSAANRRRPRRSATNATTGPEAAVSGWKLDRYARADLLGRFTPAYGRVVADHVTLAAPMPEGARRPPLVTARVVGEADDGRGVQALVVEIDGTTDRPDGSTFHITWSLAPGRRAVESNAVIRERGWRGVGPVAVALTPAIWEG